MNFNELNQIIPVLEKENDEPKYLLRYVEGINGTVSDEHIMFIDVHSNTKDKYMIITVIEQIAVVDEIVEKIDSYVICYSDKIDYIAKNGKAIKEYEYKELLNLLKQEGFFDSNKLCKE